MERLTTRNDMGIAVLKQPYRCERCGEETWSLSDHGNGEPIDKLAEYEELEEQGKLLKLPCAVGDTVYQHMIVEVDKVKRKPIYEVFEAKVFKFSLDSYALCFWTETADEKKYQNEVPLDAFGRTVFFTKEAAEIALKEIVK